jgi:hypothetical protein
MRQKHKTMSKTPAHVGEILEHIAQLLELKGSPQRGCAREAALPAASSSLNGLYAISSAVP